MNFVTKTNQIISINIDALKVPIHNYDYESIKAKYFGIVKQMYFKTEQDESEALKNISYYIYILSLEFLAKNLKLNEHLQEFEKKISVIEYENLKFFNYTTNHGYKMVELNYSSLFEETRDKFATAFQSCLINFSINQKKEYINAFAIDFLHEKKIITITLNLKDNNPNEALITSPYNFYYRYINDSFLITNKIRTFSKHYTNGKSITQFVEIQRKQVEEETIIKHSNDFNTNHDNVNVDDFIDGDFSGLFGGFETSEIQTHSFNIFKQDTNEKLNNSIEDDFEIQLNEYENKKKRKTEEEKILDEEIVRKKQKQGPDLNTLKKKLYNEVKDVVSKQLKPVLKKLKNRKADFLPEKLKNSGYNCLITEESGVLMCIVIEKTPIYVSKKVYDLCFKYYSVYHNEKEIINENSIDNLILQIKNFSK